jgi:nucleoside-diphosphate-sugar epimerase
MRYCIVGGGGYVGVLLGQRLRDDGHTVVLFDLRFPLTHLDMHNMLKVQVWCARARARMCAVYRATCWIEPHL